jgi:pimeloyl-ACP methyl ester carboxylesterase
MKQVRSKDGTSIAFDRSGDGPPMILVGGALSDRSAGVALAGVLSREFSVFTYDRRGRGDSEDAAPYAVEREVEDLEAVIDEAGGSAFVFGRSSGAALALAAASTLPSMVKKLALYEPPFILNASDRPPADHVQRLDKLVAAGRRGDAVEYFLMQVVRLPAEIVTQARSAPSWPAQEALAHTLAYDATLLGDYSLPIERAASVRVPTLVIAGGSDFPWMRETAHALAKAIPDGQSRFLDGQGHNVEPAVLAPVLVEFFKA